MKWIRKTVITILVSLLLLSLSSTLFTACKAQGEEVNSQPTEPVEVSAETAPSQTPDKANQEADETSIIIAELSETAKEFLHSGWLHFTQQLSSDTDIGNRGTLEDGTVIPAESFFECWLYLDGDLFIQKSICIQTALDGSIVQVGVRSGDVSWNSATDQVIIAEGTKAAYYSDIDAMANKVTMYGADPIVSETISENNDKLIQFSFDVSESTPVSVSDYDRLVTHWRFIYTFNPETGMIVSYQQWVTFEDGNQRLFEQVIHQQFEIVNEAPADILDYLSLVEVDS